MKQATKKKTFNIIQWCLAVIFLLSIKETGFHPSSILLIIAAFLMMPINPLRKKQRKGKSKGGIAAILAVIVFVAGIGISSDSFNVEDVLGGITSATEQENNDAQYDDSQSVDEAQPTDADSQKGNGLSNNSSTPSDSSIPKYKGQPFEILNGGKPSFTKSQLTKKAYEKYSRLDSLGRCQEAIASLGIETMPKPNEKRGSISKIHPSGWCQAKYDSISSKDLYNRCHLIGWQLSAENANPSNLITGTRYMNVDGMLPFENMVADYIKETRNHVAYRVTPVYEGKNLVASGVQIEAYSIEDDGDGICFNVYCFNVQPGIKINYANGESSGPDGGMLKSNRK